MPISIENLSKRPVLLRLNSGETLHLAPRTTFADLLAVEVVGNAKVEKLVQQRVIALHQIEDQRDSAVSGEA